MYWGFLYLLVNFSIQEGLDSKKEEKYFFNIATHVHTVYTLKSTKIHTKTLKNMPLHVSVHF